MTLKADRTECFEHELYRALPSVNEVLLRKPGQELLQTHSRHAVVEAIRSALDGVRREIASGMRESAVLSARIDALPQAIEEILRRGNQYSLRKVINATGVLLHTNLGRAPISVHAMEHVTEVACGYSNLELDLDGGERGKRDVHVESLLLSLVAEPAGISVETHRAIVVNNCAAATYLALHALARGREVVVSRGELVEIGGGFRIPEILEASGALLREVGTTNRTRAADYEAALTPETAMILRVHQSNFSMEGFVERPPLRELVALGARTGIPVFEDQGTGLLHPLTEYGIAGEPTMVESVAAGCDLIAASGDKMLGGPQCGILIGRKNLVDRIRANPLFRTARVDKLTYAALEATLFEYRSESFEEIPVIRMLATSAEEIRSRCARVAAGLADSAFATDVVETEGKLGGGTSPRARVKSYAIALHHVAHSPEQILRALRRLDPPVIGRIDADRVLLDLRTVDPEDDDHLMQALRALEFPQNEA